MATNPESERIVISDFSPGVYNDYHGQAQSASYADADSTSIGMGMPGIAQASGTYRCGADRSGALVPLPRLTAGWSRGLGTANTTSADFVTSRHAVYLLDAVVTSEMYVESEIPAQDPERAAVFMQWGAWYKIDSVYQWVVWTEMRTLFDSTPETMDLMFAVGDTAIAQGDTTKAHLGAGNFTHYRTLVSNTSAFTYQSICWNAFGAPDYGTVEPAWKSGTMSAAAQAETNYDANNSTTYPASASGRVVGIFPDYDNIATAQSKFISTSGFTAASYLATHQGRLIAGGREHGEFGQNTGGDTIGMITEHIQYGPPYDFDATLVSGGEFVYGTFGERKPHLSGVIAPVSADELLLIKYKDGGLLVRGDLDNPTVVDLPFLNGTGGKRCIPAWTPMGLVYGGQDGVYIWEGGETTRSISDQFDGCFWDPNDGGIERYGVAGRFAYWDPYIVCPNNWLYDTRLESWWRLEDVTAETPFMAADTTPLNNKLYVFPWYVDDTDPIAYRTAEHHDLAQSYRWVSQPLSATRDRFVDVRDIRVLASHEGSDTATITITLTGYSHTGDLIVTEAHAFSLANEDDHPQLLVHNGGVDGVAYVKVQVDATATAAADAAPKIHSISLGIRDARHIPLDT